MRPTPAPTRGAPAHPALARLMAAIERGDIEQAPRIARCCAGVRRHDLGEELARELSARWGEIGTSMAAAMDPRLNLLDALRALVCGEVEAAAGAAYAAADLYREYRDPERRDRNVASCLARGWQGSRIVRELAAHGGVSPAQARGIVRGVGQRSRAPRRTPERALGRSRIGHRRTRASRGPPAEDGEPDPAGDAGPALPVGVERRRGDLRHVHEYLIAFLARLGVGR